MMLQGQAAFVHRRHCLGKAPLAMLLLPLLAYAAPAERLQAAAHLLLLQDHIHYRLSRSMDKRAEHRVNAYVLCLRLPLLGHARM
jgi:hypothetical protein